jgi:hypothetical protein
MDDHNLEQQLKSAALTLEAELRLRRHDWLVGVVPQVWADALPDQRGKLIVIQKANGPEYGKGPYELGNFRGFQVLYYTEKSK